MTQDTTPAPALLSEERRSLPLTDDQLGMLHLGFGCALEESDLSAASGIVDALVASHRAQAQEVVRLTEELNHVQGSDVALMELLARAKARAEAHAAALEADKARLDFLDEANRRLNASCGTTYRWAVVMSHNVNRLMLGRNMAVDLHDSDPRGLPSCRDAIDAKMRDCGRAALSPSPAPAQEAGTLADLLSAAERVVRETEQDAEGRFVVPEDAICCLMGALPDDAQERVLSATSPQGGRP